MACPAIITGDQFLPRVLGHIDCQAQVLGSFGYQALGEPGSTASLLMTGLLTLFIALFGIRLLFGTMPTGRDIVGDVIKIGIVLTLAFSWPAFRTVVHDVVLKGPAEIASTIATPSLPNTGSGFAARLQSADNAMTELTSVGTGRNTGAFIDDQAPGGTFAGSALQDESTFGWARLFYLAGIIGSLGLLRIVAGLLLALAPLAAGLLLFEATRGVFSGWLRGLVLAMAGAVGVSIVLAVELAIIEPWLADALRVRALGYATPAAPIELLALTLAFTAVQFGMIWILAKATFTRGWVSMPAIPALLGPQAQVPALAGGGSQLSNPRPENRATRIAESVEAQMRYEGSGGAARSDFRSSDRSRGPDSSNGSQGHSATAAPARLGSSYRRTGQRRSNASRQRDIT